VDVAEAHLNKLAKDKTFVRNFKAKLRYVQRDYKTPCLEWQGGTDKAGYGRIHVKRHCERPTGRNFFAHRMNHFLETHDHIEPDELILHQCHNRLCCNVDHFEIGNHMANMDDLHNSRRVSGEKNSNSKLSEDEVWEILCMYHEDSVPMTDLAAEYGVGRGTVSDIVYGRTWQDLYNEFWGEEE